MYGRGGTRKNKTKILRPDILEYFHLYQPTFPQMVEQTILIADEDTQNHTPYLPVEHNPVEEGLK